MLSQHWFPGRCPAVIVIIPEQLHRLSWSPLLGNISHAVLIAMLLKRKAMPISVERLKAESLRVKGITEPSQ